MKLSLSSDAGADDANQVLLCSGVGSNIDTREGTAHAHSARCEYERFGSVTPTIAMSSYEVQSKPPLILFSLPGDEEGAARYSNALEPAMKFVSVWFGAPSTPICDRRSCRSEFSAVREWNIVDGFAGVDDAKLAGTNLVHELVHSAVPSARPWVYEGLAHFARGGLSRTARWTASGAGFSGVHKDAFIDAEKDLAAASSKKCCGEKRGKSVGQPLGTTFDEAF